MRGDETCDAIGIDGYAAEHQLPLAAWHRHVRTDGTMKPAGVALVDRPGPSDRS